MQLSLTLTVITDVADADSLATHNAPELVFKLAC